MVRRSVESTFSGIRFPHTWRKRALLLVSLVGIVLAFAVLSVATLEPAVAALNLMLLVGVFLCLAFVLAFSNAVMYVMQMVILVGCCLGISVGAWPGWSLHEKETRLWARVYVLATLRSAAAREVTHTLGENFEGSLQELIHTSRLLSL